jgi:excisionase family DNA binding protein
MDQRSRKEIEMDKTDRLLLRPVEAAELLGLSRSSIYGLLAAGELPVVRLGHQVRVPVAELHRWVEEHAGRIPAPPPDEEADECAETMRDE